MEEGKVEWEEEWGEGFVVGGVDIVGGGVEEVEVGRDKVDEEDKDRKGRGNGRDSEWDIWEMEDNGGC